MKTSDNVLTETQQDIEVIGLAVQWERFYGTNWQDLGISIVESRDDGFLISGARDSSYVEQNHLWLLKTDNRGRMNWEKFYDGEYPGSEYGSSIVQAHDQGYMIAGYMDYLNISWDKNALIIKVDENGDLLWPMKTFGLDDTSEEFRCIIPTPDGNYVTTGTAPREAVQSPWLIKTDGDGAVQWNRRYDVEHWADGM